MTFRIVPVVASALVLLVAPQAADAATHRPRHVATRSSSMPAAGASAAAAPFSFYPQDVEGGVSGNLPFNNQIRKHTDPLNANGSR